jgi:hypothetical protein
VVVDHLVVGDAGRVVAVELVLCLANVWSRWPFIAVRIAARGQNRGFAAARKSAISSPLAYHRAATSPILAEAVRRGCGPRS